MSVRYDLTTTLADTPECLSGFSPRRRCFGSDARINMNRL
jgi:hypothetical protein